MTSKSKYGPRIVVPQRPIQGGTDQKFDSDSYRKELYGLLTPDEYTSAIDKINMHLKKARAKKFDGLLLASGAILLVPLAIWGVRHRSQTKKRKKLLKGAIDDFHSQYPHLYMRWNRKPESKLTIERREQQNPLDGPLPTSAQAHLINDDAVAQAVPQGPKTTSGLV